MDVPAARMVFSPEDRETVLAMIDQTLQTGALTLGPHTRSFEEGFRERHGTRYAVAVSSGTSALEIILRGLGVEGRDVVVPTNTFFATAASVLHAGAQPRFADVSAETLALTPEAVEAALTDATAGVVIVHIGGTVSPDVHAIRRLCDERGLWLVEDSAHAHGSSLDGRAAGTFGVAGAFSFYPTKVMTAAEGGMIVTDDERLRDEAIIHRDQGKAGFLGGDHIRMGYAWRLSELDAAVGVVQLARLDEFISARRKSAAIYDSELQQVPGITPLVPPPGCESNYYKYIAVLEPGIDRAAVKDRLRAEFGVSCSGEVYALPLHEQPVFAGMFQGRLPAAEDICRRHLCLPIHSDMTPDEAMHVITGVRAVLADTAGT